MTKRFARVPIAAARAKGLGEHGLRVYIALCSFADKNWRCFPSLQTIADTAKIDRRHVPAALTKNENHQLIARSRTGRGRSTVYTILHPEVTHHDVSDVSRGDVTAKEARDTPPRDRVTRHDVSEGAESVTPRRALTDQEIEQTNEQTTLLPPDGNGESSEIDLAFRAWNDMATETGLPTVRKLTKPLRSSLNARLAEIGGVSVWQGTIERIRQSEFLCGGSQSGWRCSLQWLVKPSNFEKVAGGNYDNRSGGRSASKAKATMDAVDRLIEEADRNG
jgi:hypothetical protein